MSESANSSGEYQQGYEELARLAQQFLGDRPIVVLGTGATIPHGLPSMSQLADQLLARVSQPTADWDEFSERLSETKDLERALHDVALLDSSVEALVRETWRIVTDKDLAAHSSFLSASEPLPLSRLFRHLLRTADARLNVVTTNYDRIAEYAANLANGCVTTGMSPGWFQRFVPTIVQGDRTISRGFEGQVTILKVHGSLDWFEASDGDVIAVPLQQDIPSGMKPLIVTPGVSKYREVHKDPFRTVMSAADEVLREASCYFCIGYGFNDEHVQPVLLNRVTKSDVPIALIARTLTQATRQFLLRSPPKKFLFVEEGREGTLVYTPRVPHGFEIKGLDLWQIDPFMDMVTGTMEP